MSFLPFPVKQSAPQREGCRDRGPGIVPRYHYTNKRRPLFIGRPQGSPMHFSRIGRRSFARKPNKQLLTKPTQTKNPHMMAVKCKPKVFSYGLSLVTGLAASAAIQFGVCPAQAADKRPNIVMLMTDDTGWNDFGRYSGGAAGLGHPHRMSIVWPRKELSSPAGTARRAAICFCWPDTRRRQTF